MAQGLDQLCEQGFGILGDEVGEELQLEPQPQPLKGVQVQGVGWQILGCEVMPVERFDLVPGGIVHNEVAAFKRIWWDALGERIQETLKHLAVAGVEDQGGTLSALGADGAEDALP